MKKRIIAIIASLLVLCTSCFKDKDYKSTKFNLVNNCDQTIEVTSGAMLRTSFGWQERTLVDVVPSGQTLWLRTVDVTEDFSMNSVFTRIEIRRDGQLSTFDALNHDKWVKTLTSEEQDEYTLYVDSTFVR